MANSKYTYVKGYEQDDRLLPGCFIVVRLDGKGFTKYVRLCVRDGCIDMHGALHGLRCQERCVCAKHEQTGSVICMAFRSQTINVRWT
jgi:hypothetical protein